ncbi:MAG TPA: hypothetical protein VIV15_16650 [Anaerolineales bacterium]
MTNSESGHRLIVFQLEEVALWSARRLRTSQMRDMANRSAMAEKCRLGWFEGLLSAQASFNEVRTLAPQSSEMFEPP